MKHFRILLVMMALLSALTLVMYGQVPLTTNMPAVGVLGQTDFVTSPSTVLPTASVLNTPKGIAVDPTTGKLFVADYENRRVLRWSSADKLVNGAAAEAVLGQPDFVTATAGTSSSKLSRPYGICVDAGGRLWVADLTNNRVLRFDNASTIASGAAANRVLGQADFTTGTANAGGISASTMWSPIGVFVDKEGRLWVAERDNKRVLRFDNAASKSNGDPADGVLGEPNFTTNTGGLTASLMTRAYGVTADGGGRVWVGDRDNNRVLRFDSAATKADGAAADGVLGQVDFVSAAFARTQAGLEGPRGVFVDALGKLYVSDEANNRIMVYNDAANKANGADADVVLGQADFVTKVTPNPPTAGSLNYPEFMWVDNDNRQLWIADEYNNRILRFDLGISTGVNEGIAVIPEAFQLLNNYPNPFNPSTTIMYSLPQHSSVSIVVYSVLGQEVRSLVKGVEDAGSHQVVWNGRDNAGSQASTGVYFVRMVAEPMSGHGQPVVRTNRMLLLK